MAGHCFISYSHADGLDFVTRLATELEGGHPFVPVWFEKREMLAGRDDWDEQLAAAIRQCKCLLYVMSADSTAGHSNCKDEWTWALKYKKPVVCLQIDPKAEDQFRLNSRQKIDFTANFDAGLAKLRKAIAHLDSPAGQLEELKHRLADATRDLRRASPADQPRVQADIDDLKKQIEVQQKIADDPEAAIAQTQKNIEAGLERERKPEIPIANYKSSKFINPPPGIAQTYFQDRTLETEQVILFLKNDAQRLMTVAGRGGAGKTAMTCRLLKHIENSSLPDDFEKKHGKIAVDGIVYLSETGTRKVNFANLFADLCRLLPADVSARLDELYRNPQVSTDEKTHKLLEAFSTSGRVVILLDNFENVVDAEAQNIADAELDEALKAILHAPHHPLKFIITTRVTPHQFDLYEPARQRPLPLDTGLAPEFAKEAFLLMDEGGLVGLKGADESLLDLAVERTLGLPRALEALYAALRSDRYTTLAELLALPVLPENVVAAYVGEAFNRLDTNAQKVMQALAVYGRPVTPAAVDYLLAPHIPAMDSASILQRLTNMHFARKESGRYYLHPVDREFAFGLIPVEDLNTKGMKDSKEEEKVFDVPDVSDVVEVKPEDVIPASETDEETLKKANEAVEELKVLFAEMKAKETNYHLLFTRHDLLTRAADYFAQARKPRAEWKRLEDLQAQRDEFDLRCAAGDYDTAASVLTDIDFDYLLLWGQYRLMIQMHESIAGKINDPNLRMSNFNNLGAANYSLGDMKATLKYWERGIPAAQEAKSRSWEGAFLGNLGNAYAALGDARKAIEFHEQALVIAREIGDRSGEGADLGNLGNAYAALGDARKAIEFYEQALVIASEIGDRRNEGAWLGNLGNAYAALGDARKAIEFYEQALVIDREIGDRRGEGNRLGNLGNRYLDNGEYQKAIEYYKQSIEIRREIGDQNGEATDLTNTAEAFAGLEKFQKAKETYLLAIQIADNILSAVLQNYARWDLAQTYLFQNDLTNARAAIEAALGYDVPQYNHNASALHGIILLRMKDLTGLTESRPDGQGSDEDLSGLAAAAFVRAIGQADEILSKTAEYYDALDAKGLALCGSVLCGSRLQRDNTPDIEDPSRFKRDLQDAIECFRKARKIAPHAGVVKSVLRLFDELVKCDKDGVLKNVREEVEGRNG